MYSPVKQYKVIRKDLGGLIKDFFLNPKTIIPHLKKFFVPPRVKFFTKIIPVSSNPADI